MSIEPQNLNRYFLAAAYAESARVFPGAFWSAWCDGRRYPGWLAFCGVDW